MIKTIDKYKEVDAANVAQFKETGRVVSGKLFSIDLGN